MVEWIDEPPQLLGRVGQLSQADVLGLQAQMNVDNRCIGSPRAPITEDGVPGPETCAMAQFLNTKSGTAWDGSICPGGGPVGSYPVAELCAAPSRPPPAPPGPPPGESPPATSITTSAEKKPWPAWAWAALGVAVVGGFVLWRAS